MEVSPTLISNVTDAVVEEVKGWQSRPLENVVLANSDLVDKMGVAILSSIPFLALIIGSRIRRFRFLPEPLGAPA